MQLDLELIRKLMLRFEKEDFLILEFFTRPKNEREKEENRRIAKHLELLNNEGFIEATIALESGLGTQVPTSGSVVDDITVTGSNFAVLLSNEDIWKAVKDRFKTGAESVSAIYSFAQKME